MPTVREGAKVSRYRAGADFERKVRDVLKEQGAIYVCRSAGSKGPVDLIAFYPARTKSWNWNYIHFVQAKRDGRISKADQWALCELARMCGAVPILAKAGPRGTPVVLETLMPKQEAA